MPCGGEDAWQEASSEAGEQGIEEKYRIEAVEQDTEVKYSMQEQYLDEGAARQETCKSQTEGKLDLKYGRFGEYRSTHGSCRGRNQVAGCTMAGLRGRAPKGTGR